MRPSIHQNRRYPPIIDGNVPNGGSTSQYSLTIDNTGGGSATVTASYDGGNTLSLNDSNVGYNGEGDFDTMLLRHGQRHPHPRQFRRVLRNVQDLYADDSTLTIGSGGLRNRRQFTATGTLITTSAITPIATTHAAANSSSATARLAMGPIIWVAS